MLLNVRSVFLGTSVVDSQRNVSTSSWREHIRRLRILHSRSVGRVPCRAYPSFVSCRRRRLRCGSVLTKQAKCARRLFRRFQGLLLLNHVCWLSKTIDDRSRVEIEKFSRLCVFSGAALYRKNGPYYCRGISLGLTNFCRRAGEIGHGPFYYNGLDHPPVASLR